MKNGVIVVNVEKCIACKSCEIACAVAHSRSKNLEEALLEEPKPKPRVVVEDAGDFAVPMQCRHCEDAPCVAICPAEAISQGDADGPVIIDAEKCKGCRMCVFVCPFGAVRMSDDGKLAVKCDLCIERLERDELPACVVACPTGALQFESSPEAIEQKRVATAELICVGGA